MYGYTRGKGRDMSNRFCCLIVGLFGLMCAAHIANTDQVISDDYKLLASDGGATDEFGTSVAISGDIAIIGVPNDDDRNTNAGAAYILPLMVSNG